MTDLPTESCGRSEAHSAHKFMRGTQVSRCPGADCTPPQRAATCPATADQGPGVAPGGGTDPLAALRGLAAQFEQLAQDADDDVERDRYRNDQVRFALRCTATAWRHAARLTRQALDDLDNSRTTPDNPPASDDTRRRALAHNAVATTLNAHGEWLPLSVREAIADAVLAVRDAELERLRARIVTLEHVAAANKRHVQLIVPELERAEAAVARVRAIHTPVDTMAGRVCEGCMNCDPYEALPWPCRTIEALDREETPS